MTWIRTFKGKYVPLKNPKRLTGHCVPFLVELGNRCHNLSFTFRRVTTVLLEISLKLKVPEILSVFSHPLTYITKNLRILAAICVCSISLDNPD